MSSTRVARVEKFENRTPAAPLFSGVLVHDPSGYGWALQTDRVTPPDALPVQDPSGYGVAADEEATAGLRLRVLNRTPVVY